MSNSSDTSTPDTAAAGTATRPSSPSAVPGYPSDWATESTGSISTSDSTETATETSPTCTADEDDCDFQFVMEMGSRHPVGIVCTAHDWYGDVGA